MKPTTRGVFLATSFVATLALFLPNAPTEEQDYEPFPDAMTGKALPSFSVQGIYGEHYTDRSMKGNPVVIVFGTSW